MGDIGSGKVYYVVYWYPTIFHREKQRQRDANLNFEDISDKSDLPLEVKKEEVGKNLKYTLRFLDTKKEITLDLTFVKDRKNGFTVYKYDREAFRKELKDGIQEGLKKAIQEGTPPYPEGYVDSLISNYSDTVLNDCIDSIFLSCYHNAKDLYHKHEIQNGSDGRLEAYLKKGTQEYLTVEPDISTPNHEVISFFIEQYEKLFNAYAQKISEQYSSIDQKLSKYFLLNRQRKAEEDKEAAIEYLYKLNGLTYIFDHVPDTMENKDTRSAQTGKKVVRQEEIDAIVQSALDEEREENEWNKAHANPDDSQKDKKEKEEKEKEKKKYKGKKLDELRGEIWKKEKLIHDAFVDSLKSIQCMCGNALTEYNYCKSLLESKYNTEYKYDLQLTDDELSLLGKGGDEVGEELNAKDLHRKCAFNIRNSIRYIVEVRKKCDIWESEIIRDLVQKVDRMQRTTEISNSRSKKLGIWSVILAFISIGLAILGFILPDFKSCNSSCNRSETPPAAINAATDTSATTSILVDSCSSADAVKPSAGK